ncbi:hydroxyisourate hydrolase [Aquirhabdus sp.]|uniref:hydroxyisourate hydrolase n=1 Tax=Aquirhabdus sp. TaxID=2824160 RepID=UPI00396CBA6F
MLTISTHVLDTSRGLPAADIPVELAIWQDHAWHHLGSGVTDPDGRIRYWGEQVFALIGHYRLTFHLVDYFAARGQAAFFPEVSLQFQSDGALKHLHVPLLLNPYGYSTYRGS